MKSVTRKFAAAGMSLALAATAVPLTVGEADAGWRERHYRHYDYRPTRHYRHYRHHRHYDAGAAAAAGIIGLAAGAIIGGALANQGPVVTYEVAPGYSRADWDAYCYSKYRSYDPYSGTYLGYDGYRHTCR